MDEQLENHLSILSSATTQGRANIVVLCLTQDCLKEVEDVFDLLHKHLPAVPIFVAAEAVEPNQICQVLELGAVDFITAPFRSFELWSRLWRLRQRNDNNDGPRHKFNENSILKQLLGENQLLRAEVAKIPTFAECDANVLIRGETGTGKELFARAIHYLSGRRGKPFIPANCAALPLELMENELFGHQSGAFTGATSCQPGLVDAAERGTLFLDEVDSLPLLGQAKLLRLLQDGEYRAVGSSKVRKADIRVIAASNANFEESLRSGRFRSDLYYRLDVVEITLPPLRARREDIPLLARHFLTKYSARFNKLTKDFEPAALQKLFSYEWPGNIRELENVIMRAVILSKQVAISADDIRVPNGLTNGHKISFKALKAAKIAEFEKAYIRQILDANGGNVSKAALAANKNRRAFWQLMRKYQIVPLRAGSRPYTESAVEEGQDAAAR
jgi:DNA-binding NtrC family response regulator